MGIYALSGCHNCHYHGLYGIGQSNMPNWYHELGSSEVITKVGQCPNVEELKALIGGEADYGTVRDIANKYTGKPLEAARALRIPEKDLIKYAKALDCIAHTHAPIGVPDRPWSEEEFNKKYASRKWLKYALIGGGVLALTAPYWASYFFFRR